MGSIIASCGHRLTEEEGLGVSTITKDYAKDGSPVASYVTFCLQCFMWYKHNDWILNNEDEVDKWIGAKK